MVYRAPKTSWADDVDELELPKNEEFVDENGIRTTIEYTLNDEGKKSRSPVASRERYKNLSLIMLLRKDRNGQSLDRRRAANQGPIEQQLLSERMLS